MEEPDFRVVGAWEIVLVGDVRRWERDDGPEHALVAVFGDEHQRAGQASIVGTVATERFGQRSAQRIALGSSTRWAALQRLPP
jgi:hypothetical protein